MAAREDVKRTSTVNTLAELNPPDLAACLQSMLADKDEDVRAAATRVLSESAGRDLKPQEKR